MSIEGGANATSPKAAGVENSGVKSKGQAGDEAQGEGGFLSMLTALAPPAATDGAEASAQEPADAADAQSPPADAALLLQNLPAELALLLAQASEGGAENSGLPGSSLPGAAAGFAVSTNYIPDLPGSNLPGAAAGLKGRAAIGPAGSAASEVAVLDLAGDLAPDVDPLLEQSTASLGARSSKGGASASGTWLQPGADASQTQARTLLLTAAGEGAVRDAASSETLMNSTLSDSLLRQSDRTAAKSAGAGGRFDVEGLWGQHAAPGANRAAASAPLLNPSLPLLESKVADTVNYWVTQGVQNAALTLDGLGDEPVEVNISLKGREAHIGFRTDQPDIRQLLEGASVQLKDLLASEGLLLSGVSVGTSAQDGKGTPERQPRPSAQSSRIVTRDAGPGESQQRVVHAAGQTVDIFV